MLRESLQGKEIRFVTRCGHDLGAMLTANAGLSETRGTSEG